MKIRLLNPAATLSKKVFSDYLLTFLPDLIQQKLKSKLRRKGSWGKDYRVTEILTV